MQINTKLPFGAVFGDFKSSEQDLLVHSLIEGRNVWCHRCCVLYRFGSDFTFGFHTCPIGDGDLE